MCHDQFNKQCAARYGIRKANQSFFETFANICLAMQQNMCFKYNTESLALQLATQQHCTWVVATTENGGQSPSTSQKGVQYQFRRDEGWDIHLLKKYTSNKVNTPRFDMRRGGTAILTTLKEKNSNLSQVEVNKMFCFMRYITSKVAAYNTMPRWVVFLVKFFFDVCSNILKYIN